jgi:hypothetical protein
MNPKGEPGEPDWNRDHDHGKGGYGWGGLLNETSKQSVTPMKPWTGKKDGSVRNIPNGEDSK